MLAISWPPFPYWDNSMARTGPSSVVSHSLNRSPGSNVRSHITSCSIATAWSILRAAVKAERNPCPGGRLMSLDRKPMRSGNYQPLTRDDGSSVTGVIGSTS